jgi:hypothetical protein
MNAFYEHHKNSILFNYRCFDRILLNGLIQPFQQPERAVGFFSTYREQYPVSRDVLTEIADQFQKWLKNRSEKWNAPILAAPAGRRDEFVEPYLKKAKPDEVAVVLKAREPARIMTDELLRLGATYEKMANWQPFSVTDGGLYYSPESCVVDIGRSGASETPDGIGIGLVKEQRTNRTQEL